MFDDIGQKIKAVAVIIFVVGVIASFIGGGLFITHDDSNIAMFMGLGIIIGGCIGSWISVLVMYGLGQLIENSDVIREKMEEMTDNMHSSTNTPSGYDPKLSKNEKEQYLNGMNISEEQKEKLRNDSDFMSIFK